MYRKAAETALEMEATDGIDLPIIIEQLNSNLEFHVNITTDYERIRLRELYFKERVKEVTASFVGSVLACKMQCLMTFRNHIHRSLHLFKYIMFLVSLDETDDEFYEFECMTLEYFCRGYEEHVEPTETSTPLQLAFYYFNMDVVSGIPETDQFINAVTMVRNKLILLEDMSEMLPLTDDEKTMRDTYFAMAQFLKEYRHVTNVTSFLQVNKGEAKFDLMEEWFFASKKPTQHLSVPTPESC
uniref:NR LBD domain-containing protein n=2 Tax=Caenorhabditis tropicalis TaxID=1561998 RepID=A0A1I7TJW2_9PELO